MSIFGIFTLHFDMVKHNDKFMLMPVQLSLTLTFTFCQLQDLGNVSKILQGIVTVAMATIQMEKPVIIPEMLETAIVLHGVYGAI